MKKVFIIIPDDNTAGGIQRSASNIRQALEAAGLDVSVLCIKLCSNGYSQLDPHFTCVSPGYSTKFLFWIAFFWHLRRFLRAQRGSSYIALGLFPSIVLAILSIGIRRERLIGSERIYPPMERPSIAVSFLRRIFFHRLDFVVVQSKISADWYQSAIKLPASKLVVIPNVVKQPVVDLVRFPLIDISHDQIRQSTIACVGRLTDQKGFDYALRTLNLIHSEDPSVHLVIVGQGPLQCYLQDMAVRLRLQNSVSFLSPVSNLNVIFDSADVFFLPSRFEGFPNVLAEAMSYGLASVAFDCPTGPSDLIESGDNGFLCEVGDITTAATLLTRLLRDQSLRRLIGQRAKKVSSTYSSQIVGKMWYNLLSDKLP
jgi:glycosyltransferase involved in cell wall biosynthesis